MGGNREKIPATYQRCLSTSINSKFNFGSIPFAITIAASYHHRFPRPIARKSNKKNFFFLLRCCVFPELRNYGSKASAVPGSASDHAQSFSPFYPQRIQAFAINGKDISKQKFVANLTITTGRKILTFGEWARFKICLAITKASPFTSSLARSNPVHAVSRSSSINSMLVRSDRSERKWERTVNAPTLLESSREPLQTKDAGPAKCEDLCCSFVAKATLPFQIF